MLAYPTARRAALACGLLAALVSQPAFADTTQYRVTFQSTWSAATHPYQFPSGPHFSGLIGGTHTDQVSFWHAGGLASQGIKDMAEQGSKTALTQQVQDAISAGTANAVLSGNGISPSPGTVELLFDADDAYPLVTLVSMLAPSPDWFVGVTGLSLRQDNAWIPQIVVDLRVFDAGTDSGISYASPNSVTAPPVPIAENTTGSFATSNLVGTFTFTRTSVADVPHAIADARPHLSLLGANPVRDAARFELQVPSGRRGALAIYSIDGRRVRSLFSGDTAGQPSTVTWNARDERGAAVPAGVYFASLRVDGAAAGFQRLVVMR